MDVYVQDPCTGGIVRLSITVAQASGRQDEGEEAKPSIKSHSARQEMLYKVQGRGAAQVSYMAK